MPHDVIPADLEGAAIDTLMEQAGPAVRHQLESAPTANELSGLSKAPMGAGAEGGELARARAIAQRLGITNLTDDEYDVPTYMRRQKDHEV